MSFAAATRKLRSVPYCKIEILWASEKSPVTCKTSSSLRSTALPSLTFQSCCYYGGGCSFTCLLLEFYKAKSERGFSKMFFKDGCFRVYFLEVKKQKRGNPREEGPRVIPSQQCRTADLQLPGRFTTAQSRSLVRQLMRLPAEMTLDEAARTVRTGGFGFRVSFPFVFITLHTTKGEKKRIVNARTFSFIRPWKSCRLSQCSREKLIKNYNIQCCPAGWLHSRNPPPHGMSFLFRSGKCHPGWNVSRGGWIIWQKC